MRSLRVAGLLLAFSAGLLFLHAAPQPEKEVKNTRPTADRFEDALPPDAVGRLGTIRFRHGNFVNTVSVAPDGERVASAGGDGVLRVWNLQTGKPLATFEAAMNQGHLRALFCPDGKHLVTVGQDNLFRLLDASTGKEVRQFPVTINDGTRLPLGFSKDGKLFVTSDGMKSTFVFETHTGKQVRQFDGMTGPVHAAALSPDGTRVAAGDGGMVRVWDVKTGNTLQRLRRHQGTVTGVTFSPDGKLLATGGEEDATIRLWDVEQGKLLLSFSHQHTALIDAGGANNIHEHRIAATIAVFSPDGKQVYSIGKCDRFVRQWETATGKEIASFAGHTNGMTGLAVSPDNSILVACAEDNNLRLWNIATGKEVQPDAGHRNRIYTLGWSEDGKLLLSGSRDGTARLWDVATRTTRITIGNPHNRFFRVVLTPDGKTLISGRGDEETITIWDTATGKETKHLHGKQVGVTMMALSSDGKRLATLDASNNVTVWDLAAGKELRTFGQPNNSGMASVAFSPDGAMIASIVENDAIGLWEVATGKIARKIETQGQQTGIFKLAWSPDGKTISSVGGDNTVCIWSSLSGTRLHKFENLGAVSPESMMNWDSLTYSPDGRLIATVGANSVIVLFEVATGKKVREFKGHQGWVGAISFGPDGKTLASGSLDTTVLLWDVPGHSQRDPAKPVTLTRDDLDRIWGELAGEADKAHQAYSLLAQVPAQALPWLEERVKPAKSSDKEKITKLLADLDSDVFEVREKASEDLEKLGEGAEGALRKALVTITSAEVRRRIEDILGRLGERAASPDALRLQRVLAAVEQMNTPEAQKFLEGLAKGDDTAPLTRDAKAALDRLQRRAPK